MKTAKEILNNSIGKNVVWSIDGHVTVVDELNANDILSAMERYSYERLIEWKENIKIKLVREWHKKSGDEIYDLINSLT